MTWVTIILCMLAAFVSSFITQRLLRSKTAGTLRVDRSDPDDGPYLFLELSRDFDVNAISKCKYVTFEVKNENYISLK